MFNTCVDCKHLEILYKELEILVHIQSLYYILQKGKCLGIQLCFKKQSVLELNIFKDRRWCTVFGYSRIKNLKFRTLIHIRLDYSRLHGIDHVSQAFYN